MGQVTRFIPAVAVSLFLAACGSSSSSGSASPSASRASGGAEMGLVKTASVSSLGGSVLVDAQGLTLYHLSGEQNGKWICTSAACVKVWHPLAASTRRAPSGSVGSLATVKRPGGTMQVTYVPAAVHARRGHEARLGETSGHQGCGRRLTAVTTKGATTAKPAAATPAPAPSSSSGGGSYGY